jgi:membrane protein DedA with SNARE-associated domain
MFDSILAAVAEYPYVGFAVVFLLCGVGLPLPEEIGLLAAGYVCATNADRVTLHWMMVWCGGAILAGDLIPYVLGRVFGVRLLRLRWLRYLVTKQRLAKFDRWFRRRGDAVIFIARFLAGLRVVAFFTAGTMKMPWIRFLVLDGLGILVLVPVLTLVGFHSAEFIQRVIEIVQKVERDIPTFGPRRDELLRAIAPELARFILGETDSEIVFYLFLTRLSQRAPLGERFELEQVMGALRAAVEIVRDVCDRGDGDPALLTLMVTDGELLAATQGGKDLYWSSHKNRCADRDRCPSLSASCEAPSKDGNVNHFIVSSEPLSGENVWLPFGAGEIIGVDRAMNLHRAHVERRALPVLLTG